MPTDLSYFYESDMSKKSLNNFVRSLPDHLQRMFEDSFGGFNLADKDVLNVLQGYRGPHNNGATGDSGYLRPINGLQEVRYWWVITKNLMLLSPIAGLLTFGIARAVQNTDWHSLYFDSKTGECLSHNRNEAIVKLNNKGYQLFQEGKFTEAVEYCNNAYQACSSDNNNKTTFKNNRDKAETEKEAINLNSQGDDLFGKEKYAEALIMYQMAYDKSKISEYYTKYCANKEKAKAEIDAMNLNSEGDDLFSKEKYAEALNKYQMAYDKSKISKYYNKYRSNREKAKAEIDAMNLNSEGDDLFSKEKYAEALNKYQMAYDKSKISKYYNKYCANREKAKAEIDAMNLNSEGDDLFSKGKYAEAFNKYQMAFDKISTEYEKYRANREKAKAEIDAMNLNSEGDDLFSKGKYDEALNKYQMACEKTQISTEYNKYSANREKAKAEIDAMNLNSEGDDLFNKGKYAEAFNKYQMAFDKISTEYEKYRANREKAKAEIDAMNLNSEGDDLFNKGKYAEAFNKYQMAYDKSEISKCYNKYRYNRYKAKAEIDAINLNSEGDDLFNKRKYAEAFIKYQMAFDESQISIEYEKYQANKEKAQAEIDAMNLNSEGDDLFSKGKYDEALNNYQMACEKTQISIEYNKYCDNREKAQAERDAMNSNSEGDNLFSRGKYSEALSKYLKAYNKSRVHKDKFRAKRDKAKAEVLAINLNTEGDILFSEGKYGEALSKYQTAYDKSLVEKEKVRYQVNINYAQVNKNKLSILDTLWKEACDAENDTDNDRSSQATELFQKVLSETKDAVKMFPFNSRLKEYETLASLKIDGNELFNEGLELQQDAAKLFQEAHGLKLQEKLKLARIKYMLAKGKFSKAQEKFKIGREKDQRFVSCVDLIQDQLNEILQSKEVIEQLIISSKLLNLDVSVSRSDHSEADSRQEDITGDHEKYYKQIE